MNGWPASVKSTVRTDPSGPLGVVGRERWILVDAAVREERGVELGGLLGLAVEPEAGGDLGHVDLLCTRHGIWVRVQLGTLG